MNPIISTAAIAQHLNIAADAIIKVEKWATVLWVKFQGGCKFVSKKVNQMTKVTSSISRSAFAQKIAHFYEGKGLTAKVWDKDEKVRVYIKDMGYTNSRAQDQGYVEISRQGEAIDNLKNNSDARRNWGGWGKWDVIPYSLHAQRSNPDEVLAQPREALSSRQKSEQALDAMYGRGGWDRWDLEDYEG